MACWRRACKLIDKDTYKFFSISSRPGNFGTTIYNALFKHYNINAIYVPVGLGDENKRMFAHVLSSLHALDAKGVSVSMPYKKEAARLSATEANILNVNTLIPRTTGWKSYNTDTEGFRIACDEILQRDPKTAHIAGYGCVAHSIGLMLTKNRIEYKMFNVREGMDTKLQASWLINATPIGMLGVDEKFFTKDAVDRYEYVFDAVVMPPGKETNLIKLAKELNKPNVPGYKMATHQLVAQFLLYAKHWGFPIDSAENVKQLVHDKVKAMGYEI